MKTRITMHHRENIFFWTVDAARAGFVYSKEASWFTIGLTILGR